MLSMPLITGVDFYNSWLLISGMSLVAIGFLSFLRAAFDPDYGQYQEGSENKYLADISRQQYEQTRPLLEDATNQFMNLLQTGSMGAYLPVISRGIESSRIAGSRTLQQMGETMTRQGITGSERARMETQAAQQMNFDIAGIPLHLIMPLLQSLFTSVLGRGQQGMQGMAVAAGHQEAGGIAEMAGEQALQQKFAELLNSAGRMGMGKA